MAAGEFVFLDYKNGVRTGAGFHSLLSITYHQVGPQIEIKYKLGGKQFIHRASQSDGVRKGMTIDLSIPIKLSSNIDCDCDLCAGVAWYFNKMFPHTELFEDFLSRSVEAGGSIQ